mmetsp:Transcript_13931/g.10042  ORF Transcript_13931/g.10042 Transcript_13931/m.10042 type:complete len:85 (+) Transcript_13931:24-278(+)
MWYVYLNRNQHYLRSYRTHNLWLDQYMDKIRTPRVHSFHIGLFKRFGKTYSGSRVMAMMWGFTFCAMAKFLMQFKQKAAEDKKP